MREPSPSWVAAVGGDSSEALISQAPPQGAPPLPPHLSVEIAQRYMSMEMDVVQRDDQPPPSSPMPPEEPVEGMRPLAPVRAGMDAQRRAAQSAASRERAIRSDAA